jgi:hypothetical protein
MRFAFHVVASAFAIALALAGCRPPESVSYIVPGDAGLTDSQAAFDYARAQLASQLGVRPIWRRDGEVWLCEEYSLPDGISVMAYFHKARSRAFLEIRQVSDTMLYARTSEKAIDLVHQSSELLTRLYGGVPAKRIDRFEDLWEVFGADLHRRCA